MDTVHELYEELETYLFSNAVQTTDVFVEVHTLIVDCIDLFSKTHAHCFFVIKADTYLGIFDMAHHHQFEDGFFESLNNIRWFLVLIDDSKEGQRLKELGPRTVIRSQDTQRRQVD